MTNMAKESANPDQLLGAIARRQHGIIAFEQLLAAGLGPSSISLRVRTGAFTAFTAASMRSAIRR
jgi:hypothetical protein